MDNKVYQKPKKTKIQKGYYKAAHKQSFKNNDCVKIKTLTCKICFCSIILREFTSEKKVRIES